MTRTDRLDGLAVLSVLSAFALSACQSGHAVGPSPILVSVKVQLLVVGGTSNPPPPSPVAGAVEALSGDNPRSVAAARTDASGNAMLRVPPGIYTFAGYPGPTGNWGCRSYSNITISAHTSPSVEVSCAVP